MVEGKARRAEMELNGEGRVVQFRKGLFDIGRLGGDAVGPRASALLALEPDGDGLSKADNSL